MRSITFFICTIFSCIIFSNCESNFGNSWKLEKIKTENLKNIDSLNRNLLLAKASEAKNFCADKKYSDDFCFLINMHVHSGKYRFYIWDLKTNNAIDSGLVSHGCGEQAWGYDGSASSPVFSNTYESHCSSLGKYKVGKRDWSQWGIHVKYVLHGLDSTNSNALGRQIVFHSWDMIGNSETYPAGTPEGWGCPAISNEFLTRIDEKLKETEKPVLMWIFNN